MPIHDAYGGPLPELSTVRLEENVAEKVARLNRTTTARDVYDLVWIWRHYRDGEGLDRDLVRRLAVLKIWVDAFGLHSRLGAHWKPGHEARPFDPDAWLRVRPTAEFDREDIGELTVPHPTSATWPLTWSAGTSSCATSNRTSGRSHASTGPTGRSY